MSRTGGPGQDAARRHVLAELERCRHAGTSELPLLRAMAASAGVAYVTMWKAVRRLKAEGVIKVRHGGRARVADGAARRAQEAALAPDAAVPVGATAAERLRAAFDRDLLRGQFSPGSSLPNLKELAERYGVGYRTLRRAFDGMVSDGTLEACRRGYRVPSTSAGQSGGVIALVLHADSSTSGIPWHTQMTQEYVRALESECSRAGTTLRVVPCTPDCRPRALLSSLFGSDEGRRRPVLGVVLRPESLSERLRAELVDGLVLRTVPVAWLDESGERAPPVIPGKPSTFHVFVMSRNHDIGVRMARFLLARGHRKLAYVSPVHWAGWSQSRLEGIQEACGRSGLGASVVPVVVDEERDVSAPLSGQLSRRIDTVLRDTLGNVEYGGVDSAFRTLNAQVHSLAGRAVLRQTLAPLLRRARGLQGVSAWVCANDTVALECLDYLTRRKVAVPGELSVCGFDDTTEGLGHGLTTWNFNRHGAVSAIVGYLLGPLWQRQRTAGFTPVEGYVVERRTVAGAE